MIASVHLVDTGVVKNITRRVPKPARVPGLLWSGKAICAKFGPGALPNPDPRRGGMVAWWKNDAALDAWLATDSKAGVYTDGLQVRLRPTRGRASWLNADFDVVPTEPTTSTSMHVATTSGRVRPLLAPKFLKVSGDLEEQFVNDPGGVWGVAITMPPRTIMTLTFWESVDATNTYIRSGAHGEAMKNNYDFPTDTHDYVIDGGFFGFEPYDMSGELDGKNPTPPGFADSVS